MRYILLFVCLIFLPGLAGAEDHFKSQKLSGLRVVQTNPSAQSADMLGAEGNKVTVHVGDTLADTQARIIAINAVSITVKTAKGRTRLPLIAGSFLRPSRFRAK